MTTIFIKNMVCARCKWVVSQSLQDQGLIPLAVRLGEVDLSEMPDADRREALRKALAGWGFELLDDRRAQTVEQIKNLIIREIHYGEAGPDGAAQNLSERLSQALGRDYASLSRLFSEVEDQTIEQFFIRQKIERVKELLVYDELSLSEIAWQLGYSSVQYLSNQFKKVTGFTPTHYKQVKANKRKSLDEL